jgi:CubicO group peptidase (beta-lactamase class C family)
VSGMLAPMWMLLFACGPDLGEPDRAAVVLEPGVPWEVRARDFWPTEGWAVAAPEEVGMDAAKLADAEAYAFERAGDDADRKGIRTNALVVVRGGRLVLERYARDYTADTPMLTWSVTKSFVNTMVGVAVRDGKIDVNAPAWKYYAPLDRDGARDIRVTDLLRMSSGLDWDESYETSPVFSSVMGMLYTRGRDDMALFAASRPLRAAPGTYWSYSSGDTNVLSAVLEGAVGREHYPDYPWEAVFDRIGVTSAVLETDGAGHFVGSSYLYATPRDLAKWAFLYLNDGVWDGERILAEGWVRYTTTLAPSFRTTPVRRNHAEDNPGAQWYVNVGDPERDLDPPLQGVPTDTFGAQGHWGKRIWVIPSKDLVVVRMGDDRDGSYDDAELLRRIVAALNP